MRFEPHIPFLIENHSIDHATLFRNPADYNCFLHKIRKDITKLADIFFWILLPESFQIILSPKEIGCADAFHLGEKDIQLLTRKIGTLLSSYAQHYNRKYGRSGSLFCQKTKAICLDPNNPELIGLTSTINCFELLKEFSTQLHNKPVELGLVTNAQDWTYSSLKDFIGQRKGTLCNIPLALKSMQTSIPQIKKQYPGLIKT